DFNACFGAHEKNGRAPSSASYHDFLLAMTNYSLTCLNTKGPRIFYKFSLIFENIGLWNNFISRNWNFLWFLRIAFLDRRPF
ncbi:conserved hypothetical protein, partial [Ricinus communis]